MHSRSQRAILVAILALAGFLCSGAGATDTTDTYSDPAGDVNAGWTKIVPDIAQVTLASDSDGSVTFDVHLATGVDLLGGAPGSGLSWIYVALDVDKNPATGGDWGDYVAYQIGPRRFNVRRWDGSAYSDFPHQPTSDHFSGTDLTFTLNRRDLGVTTFDFFVIGGNLGEADRAPDNGEFSYPPTITSLLLPTSHLSPKAGRIYRISGVTARLSNDATAVPDQLACDLAYRGKTLRPLAGGCAWRIPRSYRRKTLRLSITATYRGLSATFPFVVRPR
jgi:hypothetical protein